MVDDERVPRRLASRLLSEEGYRLLEADGAPEALEVLQQWPDQRILYMSAHHAEVVRQGLPTHEVPFLPKPYTRDEALAKVRQALEP